LQSPTLHCSAFRRAGWHPARLALPLVLAVALSALGAQRVHAVEVEAGQEHNVSLQSRILSRVSSFTDRATNLAIEAMSLIGIHYKRGGTSPQNGLDCSGLVRYVFREANGTELPRTSAEMSKVGEQVDKSQLQPGDLVFFNTLKRTFSHVGIYLGDNKFIHAPSSGGTVRIESMDLAYWKARFNGARRIPEAPQADPAK
jgi:cell wall-associated NlpC family hydrolase